MSSSSTTSNFRASKGNDCPYAVALLSHGNVPEEGDASTQSTTDEQEHVDLLAATRQNCPAFSDSGCPFKEAATSDDIKETLLKVPSSHYEMSTFTQMLRGIHATNTALPSVRSTSDQYRLPGGECPIPEDIRSSSGGFRQTLESMSVAAIMAKLAQQHERQPEEGYDSSDDFTPPPSPDRVVASVAVADAGNNASGPHPPTLPPSTARREDSVSNTTLSHQLKTGTAVAHEAAENVHFVKNFIRGQIDRRLYGEMILSLYYVYVALEEALDQHGPVQFGPCHFPKELARTQTLQDDVEFWHGDGVLQNLPPPSAATVDYVNRIQDIARTEPLLLLAHSYTRYLGDLSGGKILARVAQRALSLDRNKNGGPTDGLAFYHFEEIDSAKLFKDEYRQALDDLPLTPDQIQRLVQEANVAFLLNMRLFEELDVAANVPNAKVRPLEDVLRIGPGRSDASVLHQRHGADGSAEKCPFLMEKKEKATGAEHASASSSPSLEAPSKARCPWPFVVFHDPKQFAKDWQTWALLGLLLGLVWFNISSAS